MLISSQNVKKKKCCKKILKKLSNEEETGVFPFIFVRMKIKL